MSRSKRTVGVGGKQRGGDDRGQGEVSSNEKALVEWLTGPHAHTFSQNVLLDWVKDFDRDNVNYDESYCIEWRVPPRPSKGWNLYDARIIEISEDDDFLLRRMKEIMKSNEDESNDDDNDNRTERTPTRENIPLGVIKNFFLNLSKEEKKSLFAQMGLESLADRSVISPKFLAGSETDPPEETVRIGKSLHVTKLTYHEASSSPSSSRMTTTLIRAAFKPRRLRSSTYAGQKRLVDGVEKTSPGLKRYQKTADIQAFVKKRFPHMTQSAFCIAVNSVVGRRAILRQDREYVEESDMSESEDEDRIR